MPGFTVKHLISEDRSGNGTWEDTATNFKAYVYYHTVEVASKSGDSVTSNIQLYVDETVAATFNQRDQITIPNDTTVFEVRSKKLYYLNRALLLGVLLL
jgi:hypothetical protein